MLQSLGLVENCVGLYVPLLEFNHHRSQDLARFGLNLKADADSDQNSITEKWEGLALIPARDPRSKDDYILLVGKQQRFQSIDRLS